jgi:putative chitinase
MISLPVLIAAGVKPTQARAFLPVLQAMLPRWGIDNPARVAGWLGQVVVESAGMTALEEGLHYTTAARLVRVWPSRFPTAAAAAPFVGRPKELANRVYAKRNGNGDEASGDGWRYRGRGLKQLTGRTNYANAARRAQRDYVGNPDLVALPDDAVLTAAIFWADSGANAAADAQDWDRCTRLVNGPAMLQAAERARASRAALRAMAGAR